MNAPVFLLIAVYLLFAFIELTAHFPANQSGMDSPADTPPVNPDEDADSLPFGPTPYNQD